MQSTFIAEGFNYYDLLKLDANKLVKVMTPHTLIELKKVDFNKNFPSYFHNLQKKREALVSLKEQQQLAELYKENIIFFKKQPSDSTFTRHNDATSANLAPFQQIKSSIY